MARGGPHKSMKPLRVTAHCPFRAATVRERPSRGSRKSVFNRAHLPQPKLLTFDGRTANYSCRNVLAGLIVEIRHAGATHASADIAKNSSATAP